MDTVYTRKELEDTKYADLLQIHKNLGLRGRRLKVTSHFLKLNNHVK